MTNRTDREELLGDVLGGDFRAESLTHTLAVARRVKRVRRARRGIAVALCAAVAATLAVMRPTDKPPVPVVTQPGPAIPLISDDELLAHFPGRAVALIGPPERRQLVFLDAAR